MVSDTLKATLAPWRHAMATCEAGPARAATDALVADGHAVRVLDDPADGVVRAVPLAPRTRAEPPGMAAALATDAALGLAIGLLDPASLGYRRGR